LNKGTQFEPNLEIQSLEVTVDDIPEAVRSGTINSVAPSANPVKKLFLGSSLLLMIIGIILGFFVYRPTVSSQSNPLNNSANGVVNGENQSETADNADVLLGHLKYEEAPESELKAITADQRFKLRVAAADKFMAMQEAARRDGVMLSPISAFRTMAEQDPLFFKVKEQRGQDPTQRAAVSAPPGYSEHHTGYAIDVGDGNAPATNLNQNFENTKAFQWLEQNASTYSFELSFPPDNAQGVSYEPWHWRFVGDRHSLETFYKAKNLTKSKSKQNNPEN
jgi:D-alanyl-D-alanine carboxypeptidase